jgi:hypothetical protein
MHSADGQHVSIPRSLMAASPDDPVLRHLTVGRDLGMLAIEFASRRRLRINGTAEAFRPTTWPSSSAKALPTAPNTFSGATTRALHNATESKPH